MSAVDATGAARRGAALERALGPVIAAALREGDVVEVLINADGKIWIDRVGEPLYDTGALLTVMERETAIRLLAHEAGESVGERQPSLATILPQSGARVQALLAPLVAAPVLAIRKRASKIYGLKDYVADGIASDEQAALLAQAVAGRRNIVVAGGTGSGKTTLLNALLAEPGFIEARVLILEDTAELQCASANCVALLTRRAPMPVPMGELVKLTMRLRPDRIVVGEVRDGAALEVLKAWNTGHPGGLLSVHANSAGDALIRLEDLALEASAGSPARLVNAAVDVVVYIEREVQGRCIKEIVQRR